MLLNKKCQYFPLCFETSVMLEDFTRGRQKSKSCRGYSVHCAQGIYFTEHMSRWLFNTSSLKVSSLTTQMRVLSWTDVFNVKRYVYRNYDTNDQFRGSIEMYYASLSAVKKIVISKFFVQKWICIWIMSSSEKKRFITGKVFTCKTLKWSTKGAMYNLKWYLRLKRLFLFIPFGGYFLLLLS